MPRFSKDSIPLRTVGARVKKAKVVFDPSVNNLPKKRLTKALSVSEDINHVQQAKYNKTKQNRRLSSKSLINNSSHDEGKINKTRRNSSKNHRTYSRKDTSPSVLEIEVELQEGIQQITNNDTCVVCEKSETNKRNKKLISCKDCDYKIHPGCLKINFQNPNLAEERWRCKNCKTCVVCDETREAGYLLTCCVCVDAYHFNCHTPNIQRSDVNKVKWECYKCSYIMKETLPNKISLIDEEFNQNDTKKKLPPSEQMINNFANIEAELITQIQNNDDAKFIINPLHKLKSESRSSSSLSTTSSTKTKNNEFRCKSIIKPKFVDRFENKNNNRHTPTSLDNDCEMNKLSFQTKKMKLGNNENELKSSSKKDIRSNENDLKSLSKKDIKSIIRKKINYKDICNKNEYFYDKFFKSEDEIPDITNWSPEQIAEYVKKYLPNEAHIFRDQEIDGRSCLLLKRSDIINCFELKLGAAIRLYSLIVALQTKGRDITLSWM